MSPPDIPGILRKHGKWVGSSEFASLIAKEKGITERHAYRLIKEEVEEKGSIKKIMFPDRSTIYGLPEFGPVDASQIANPAMTSVMSEDDIRFNLVLNKQRQTESIIRDLIDAVTKNPEDEELEMKWKRTRESIEETLKVLTSEMAELMEAIELVEGYKNLDSLRSLLYLYRMNSHSERARLFGTKAPNTDLNEEKP